MERLKKVLEELNRLYEGAEKSTMPGKLDPDARAKFLAKMLQKKLGLKITASRGILTRNIITYTFHAHTPTGYFVGDTSLAIDSTNPDEDVLFVIREGAFATLWDVHRPVFKEITRAYNKKFGTASFI